MLAPDSSYFWYLHKDTACVLMVFDWALGALIDRRQMSIACDKKRFKHVL